MVLLIPSKSYSYDEFLAAAPLPPIWKEIHHNSFSELQKIVPTFYALNSLQENPHYYMQRDTHWSPEGARKIASELADYVIQKNMLPDNPIRQFVTAPFKEIEHTGDLIAYIPNGFLPASTGITPEKIMLFQTEPLSDETTLFGDQIIPVALVGTSFSAAERWNFTGFLKESLQHDVINISDPGVGPFAPMLRFMKEFDYERRQTELVIWEIPLRLLPRSYETTKVELKKYLIEERAH